MISVPGTINIAERQGRFGSLMSARWSVQSVVLRLKIPVSRSLTPAFTTVILSSKN